MKRFACLLLVIMLLPCAAALAEEEYDYYESALGFSILYPVSLLKASVATSAETGWDTVVFEPVSKKEKAAMTVCLVDHEAWTQWEKSGFPDFLGGKDLAKRVKVDEPDVEMEEITMDMSYAKYQSKNGKRIAEVVILQSPTDDLDYVIAARYPSGRNRWGEVFRQMMESMLFTRLGSSSGSFVMRYNFTGDGLTYSEVTVDEEAEPAWLYAESDVTDFVLERVEWDDASFTVTGAETLYTDERFTGGEALCIRAYYPDMLPTLRIRAVNSVGEEETWYITQSGMDGQLLMLNEEELLY